MRSEPFSATAVLCTIPSDSHTGNLVYLHLLLEEYGFLVVNLGACTPAEEIEAAIVCHAPELVVISTVNGHGMIEGRTIVQRLRQLGDWPIVIGGNLGLTGDHERHVSTLLGAGYSAVFTGANSVDDFCAYLTSIPPIRQPCRAGSAA
jgi:methylaspartate mutase sigma subunit